MLDTGKELGGYRREVGLVIQRSWTDWYRSARVDVGSSSGVVRNSPVVAGTGTGAALVGYVTSVSSNSAAVAFITDGRTEVGATIPEAGNFPGVLQSTTPGQLQLTGVPRAAGISQGQTVVTSGFKVKNLLSVYPPGIPVGAVTSFGSQEVDVQQTVQVTPVRRRRAASRTSWCWCRRARRRRSARPGDHRHADAGARPRQQRPAVAPARRRPGLGRADGAWSPWCSRCP